jgi:hypothetical protein
MKTMTEAEAYMRLVEARSELLAALKNLKYAAELLDFSRDQIADDVSDCLLEAELADIKCSVEEKES